MASKVKSADDSVEPVVTTLKPTKAEYQRADYEREAANASVIPSKAIPGRWYVSSMWGRVLCCGTTDYDQWIAAFAHRQEDGRTVLKYIHDEFGSLLTDSPIQSW